MKKRIIIGSIIFVFIFIAMIMDPSTHKTNTSNTARVDKQEKTVKKETKQHEYNVDVQYNAVSIKIHNNESSDLNNCKLKLNDSYTLVAPLPAGKDSEHAYGEFTKSDGTIFKIDSIKPTSIAVSNCNNDGGFNYFGINVSQ